MRSKYAGQLTPLRGGEVLERARMVDTIVFDKTGTLTLGKPSVTDVVALDGAGVADILRLAASAEMDSEHPLAVAVRAEAEARGISAVRPSSFEAVPGNTHHIENDHACGLVPRAGIEPA